MCFSALSFAPSLDQTLEEEAVAGASGTDGAQHSGICILNSGAAWTFGAHLLQSGQLLYSPFLLCLQESLCCLSSLDLHVGPWQTQKSHKWGERMDVTRAVTPGCPPSSLWAPEMYTCPLSKCVPSSRGAGMSMLPFGKPQPDCCFTSDHKHAWFIPSGLKTMIYFQLIQCSFPHWILPKDTGWLGSGPLMLVELCQASSSPTHSPKFAVPHHINLRLCGTTNMWHCPYQRDLHNGHQILIL